MNFVNSRHGWRTPLACLATLGTLAVAGPAAAADMTPALQQRLEAAAPADEIAVMASLHRQVDGERYADRPAALLRALRATAGRTQDGVAEAVTGPVRSFWLVNAVAFTGSPAEIRAVAADPVVATVDLDRPVRVALTAPVTGTPYPDAGGGGWGVAAINAPQAWSRFGVRGEGVRVGNIDTGVNADHPDLAGRLAAWRDFINGGPQPYDDNGHGTHTAGIIVGGSAGGGPIGVAPGATLVAAKGMAADGIGPGSALLAAAEWMTDPDGDPATADFPRVINNSWSSSAANDTWFRPMVRRWRELGIVPVFSAGNTGPSLASIGSPASYPEVIAVGAIDRDGTPAPFSGRGPVTWQNRDGLGPEAGTRLLKPDVAAPGVAVVSSVGNGYVAYSGTSMASPEVAGVIALIVQASPGLDPDQIAEILRLSATDAGAPGPDDATGHGRIDAVRALEIALGVPGAPAPGPAQTGPSGAPGPPAVAFTATPAAVTSDQPLRYTVSFGPSAQLVRLRVDGGPWGPATRGAEVVVRVAEGRHVVEAQGLDDLGRGGGPLARHVVDIDRTPPAVRVGWRRSGRKVTFVAKASDPSGLRPRSLRWSLGGGDVATGVRVRRVFADDARRRIVVTAVDAAGNGARVARSFRPRGATPVRSLRVTRRAKTVTVTGSLRHHAVLRVRVRPLLRPSGGSRANASEPDVAGPRTGRAVAAARARRGTGRFSLRLPVGAARPGTYQVELAVAGRPRAVALRTIMLR